MQVASTPSESLRCSVVVPVYNGAGFIERCLDALARPSGATPDMYEIIVVDDGSTDRTVDLVRGWIERHPDLQCRLVRQANSGPAVARNHGAQVARGDVLLFTDADCAPVPHWMRALLTPFADPLVAGAKGSYLSEQAGIIPRFVQAEYEERYRRMARRSTIDFIDTYSAAYRRSIFSENGGFDARLRVCEDQEFSFRLVEKGYRLVFVPEAQVLHLHDVDVEEYARRKFSIGFWKALLTRLHPKRMVVEDSHTPQTVKVQMLLVAAALAVAPFALVGRGVRAARGLLAVLGIGFLSSALPFERHLAERSPLLALAGPWMMAVRAAALGFGYLAGALYWAKAAPAGEPSTRLSTDK